MLLCRSRLFHPTKTDCPAAMPSDQERRADSFDKYASLEGGRGLQSADVSIGSIFGIVNGRLDSCTKFLLIAPPVRMAAFPSKARACTGKIEESLRLAECEAPMPIRINATM